METKEKKTVFNGLFLTCMLMLSTFLAKAEETGVINKTLSKELSKDGMIGYYIIGGILGFGIIAFIVVTIYDKKHENDDKDNSNIKHIAHHKHHHHHHRVIKKSA